MMTALSSLAALYNPKLKTESYHDANFLVTDGTASCHNENI